MLTPALTTALALLPILARAADAPAAPPPGPPPATPAQLAVFIMRIKPALNALIVSSTFIAVFFCMIVASFYFSTRDLRKSPIFILNVATMCLAIAAGGMIDRSTINSITTPGNLISPSLSIGIGVNGIVQSILVGFILILRIHAVYPPRTTPALRRAWMLGIPIIMKVARLVNLFVFVHELVTVTGARAIALKEIALISSGKPFLKIEWFMEVFDNMFASALFCWKLWSAPSMHHMPSFSTTSSAAGTLRVLFWIAISNFVIPALFSLAQIVLVFCDTNLLDVNLIVLVNTSVAIIGVVFATLWTSTAREDRQSSGSRAAPQTSTIVFDHSGARSGTGGGTGTMYASGTGSVSVPGSAEGAVEDEDAVGAFSESAADLKDPEKGDAGKEARVHSQVVSFGSK